jgi:ATP-dependent DNA helicase RecG
MNDTELEKLMVDLESDRVERKTSASDTNKISQVICAFANDLPNHRQSGVVFVGVKDDGSCAGLNITDELIRKLTDMRLEGNIVPIPSMMVQKKNLKGCEVAVIIVQPADAPPVRYKGQVWIRVGSSRAVANPDEERRLGEKRRGRDVPFDIQPIVSASIENDIDMELFRREYLPNAIANDVLERNQRTLEQQLMSLRFAISEESSLPTFLGIMVAGKDPRNFIPGYYIQFMRIDGLELTDPIKDQKEIAGPLSQILNSLDDTFKAHIFVSSDLVSSSVEKRHPDYPLVALQQLARNAVLHRNYEGTNAPVRITWFNDRIEIQSPGGPFGQVNRQNFGQPGITDYRNPNLAEAMKNLGYVQRFGMGIPMARKELEGNGNPPPEFIVEDTNILVTLKKR